MKIIIKAFKDTTTIIVRAIGRMWALFLVRTARRRMQKAHATLLQLYGLGLEQEKMRDMRSAMAQFHTTLDDIAKKLIDE